MKFLTQNNIQFVVKIGNGKGAQVSSWLSNIHLILHASQNLIVQLKLFGRKLTYPALKMYTPVLITDLKRTRQIRRTKGYLREMCKLQNINPTSPTPTFPLGIVQIITKASQPCFSA